MVSTLAVDGWAVTFGTSGCGSAQAPPRSIKCNSPPINGHCTNFILFDVAVYLPLHSKRLTGLITRQTDSFSAHFQHRSSHPILYTLNLPHRPAPTSEQRWLPAASTLVVVGQARCSSHRTRDHRWPCVQFNCSSNMEQFTKGSAVFRVTGHFSTPPEN